MNTVKPLRRLKKPLGYGFLGTSEMAGLIAKFDWSVTSLGQIENWTSTVRMAVSMMLQSPVPIILLWGEDGYAIYNDAYSVFAAGRHPHLLGQTVVEAWPEVADFNRNVMKRGLAGKTLAYQDQTLTLYRNNRPEEVSMDLSYSPILDETGLPVGVMAIVIETTSRVTAEQKQRQAEAKLFAEREKLHTLFMEAPAIIAVLRGPTHIFELANPMYMQLVGQRPVVGKPIQEALPELVGQGIYDLLDQVYKTGKAYIGNEVLINLDRGHGELEGTYFNFVYQATHDADGKVDGTLVHAVEVTEQVEARKQLERHNQVLEMITSGATLADALEFLLRNVEGRSAIDMKASILLLDDDQKHLRHGAAPSLPSTYNKAIDGISIGVGIGSCGTAAFTRKPVFDNDIMTDSNWINYRDLAAQFNLRACWSTPIMSSNNQVLGTFAIYYPDPREPSEEDRQIIEFATRTAALIIERKKSEKAYHESEIQKQALIRSNKTKDEFIAMASHQLRTPATAVKQYAGILLEGMLQPLQPDQQKYLQIAYDSNERELTIIDQLLKTAQLDSDKYEIDPQPHDIITMLEGCIEELLPTFESRDQVVKLQTAEKRLLLQVDAPDISLALSNLLENASKYSGTGKVIEVSIKKSSRFAEITVADQGVGIDKADQQRIFDRFTRVNNELSDTVSGSGLGLYWVKQITELHKGSIKLTSDLGKGSKFTMRLPL